NSYGKGRAWYLNFNLSKFETLRKKSQHRVLCDFVREILSQIGIKNNIYLVDEKGNIQDECQVFVYRQGSAFFIGLLPDISFQDGSASKKVRMIIPEGYQVFDMRNTKPVNLEQIVLEPGIAQFYSLLPYRVENIEIKAQSEIKAGENMMMSFSINASKGVPENHVLRVEVYDPSDREISWYSSNLVSTKGRAEHSINLPLNAEKGKWKIIAKDLPSGLTKTKEFEVK
ncbi:MAG TPA: hypothetical protein PL060_06615, partial [bacterium]|nr:hypothetical protein [bacterium]